MKNRIKITLQKTQSIENNVNSHTILDRMIETFRNPAHIMLDQTGVVLILESLEESEEKK